MVTTMVNTATVGYRYSELNLADNLVTETTTLNGVNLELTKDVSDEYGRPAEPHGVHS
jgi:hypothetical protein